MSALRSDCNDLWILELGQHVPDAVKPTARFELEGKTAAFASREELEQFAHSYGYEGNCWHLTKHEISEAPAVSVVPDEVVKGNADE